jgi:hypothetical protein
MQNVEPSLSEANARKWIHEELQNEIRNTQHKERGKPHAQIKIAVDRMRYT